MAAISTECREFMLRGTHTGKLATVCSDGRPHVVPIWFDLDGDTIVFTSGGDTLKTRNIRRDGRVALSIDTEEPPYGFVLIEGNAIIANDDDVLYWATRLGGRYMGQDRAEEYGKRNGVPGEVVIRVSPTKVIFHDRIAD